MSDTHKITMARLAAAGGIAVGVSAVMFMGAPCRAALQVSAPSSGAAPIQVFERSAIHFWRLDNGLRVVVKEDHSIPVVALNIVIRAGTRCETAHNNGISHFVEHMMFRAARAGGQDSLSGPIEAVGGIVNGGTLRDFTHYTAVTASGDFEVALDALAGALLHPKWDPAAVVAERLVLLREAQQLAEQPAVLAWDLAFKLAYQGHPYALPIAGDQASLASIDAAALAAFHRQWYAPGNASLVIVGDIGPVKARAAVARAFSGWKAGAADPGVPSAPQTPPLAGPLERVVSRDIPYAVALMGFRAPGISHPREVCATDVLLTLLGEGYTSRLKRALVDTKLANEVAASFLTHELPGLLGIQATCSPQRAQQVRRAIEQETARLREEPVSPDELLRARQRLVHDFVFANETFEDQASTLGFYEAISTYEFALTYLDEARSITAGEVQGAARACLDPARAVWVVIAPQVRDVSAPAPSPRGPGVSAALGARKPQWAPGREVAR
jgi:zinc protease